jgi:ABC-type oligopeptide transport system substrate-binding subunit
VNFRGLPPKAVDELKSAMGDKLTVQESPWNCALFVSPNHKVKPFDDPRVRRALSLALDRYEGSRAVEDRDRQDGRRPRVPGAPARRLAGRAEDDRGLRHGHRRGPHGGAPAAPRGGRAR